MSEIVDPEKLLQEMEDNKQQTYGLLDKISKFRNQIEQVMPQGNDLRNRYVVEQKMKTITEVIKAEIDIRKTLNNFIKEEYELNKKVEKDKAGNNNENIDIRKLMEMLDSVSE